MKFSSIRALGGAALLAFYGALGAVQAEGADPTVLRVALEPAFPPYCFVDDGKVMGFDKDLLDAIAQELGLKVQYTTLSFDDIIPGVMKGDYDLGASAFIINAERLEKVECTDHYTTTGLSLVISDFYAGTVNNMRDADGKTICVEKSTLSERFARTLKKSTIKGYPGEEVNDAFNRGDCQITINERLFQSYNLKVGNIQDGILLPDIYSPHQVAFVLQKGNIELTDRINQGLQTIRKNGTYDRIFDSWFTVDVRTREVENKE